jgi:hypothetical protein
MTMAWHDVILLFLPGLIAMINKPAWPGAAKFAVALGVCFVAALAELLLTGACTLSDFPGTMAKVSVLVFGSYAALWKRFEISDKIESGVNG